MILLNLLLQTGHDNFILDQLLMQLEQNHWAHVLGELGNFQLIKHLLHKGVGLFPNFLMYILKLNPSNILYIYRYYLLPLEILAKKTFHVPFLVFFYYNFIYKIYSPQKTQHLNFIKTKLIIHIFQRIIYKCAQKRIKEKYNNTRFMKELNKTMDNLNNNRVRIEVGITRKITILASDMRKI